MEVDIERVDRLTRRMSFQIPAQRIYDAVQGRLRDLSGQIKVAGFRQGRVPLGVVEQMLGPQVRQDVIEELLMSFFQDAVNERNIQPTGAPKIEWKAPEDEGSSAAAPQFVAVFEVDPEFVPAPVEEIVVEQPVTEIDDASVSLRIEELRRRHGEWQEVDRPAREGDQVVADLQGHLDDEPLYEIRRIPVVLGNGPGVPGLGRSVQNELIRGLAGAVKGCRRDLDIGFPADHQHFDLAGQLIRFTAQVHSVAAPVLPELDSHFARKLGVPGGDPDAIRAWVKTQMEIEQHKATRALVKRQIFDALLRLNPIEVPRSRIENLFERLFLQTVKRMNGQGFQTEDLEIASLLIEDKAREQVAIDLILSRIAREQGLDGPPESPEYRSQFPAAMGIEAGRAVTPELEEGVVDWVFSRAKVIAHPIPFFQLIDRWKRSTA